MTNNYLPRHATTLEACEWLQVHTGNSWTLARLLESGLMPWFWLNYKPGYPAIFGNRVEGYLAPMVFAGDMQRLEADGADALVNMTRTHDGVLMKVEPGMRVPTAELKFKRDHILALSQALQATIPSPAPVETEGTSGTPATQGNIMKKTALIAALEHEWRSIETDISDATRNGLKAAAHTGKHGEWDADKARAWAVSKGKIKQTAPVHSLAAVWPGATTRHTISR